MDNAKKIISQEIIKIIKDISGSEIEDNKLLSEEYLDSGLINSLQVVEMIVKIESVFEIKFSPDDLQSAKFRTPGGIIELVGALKNKKN